VPQFPGIASVHVSNQRCNENVAKNRSKLPRNPGNCTLHAETIFVGRGKNYANLLAVVKICQIFISKLLKAVNSHLFNQSDLDTRSWYHGTAASMECLQALPSLPRHLTAFGSSRSPRLHSASSL